jgi:transposase-like protein
MTMGMLAKIRRMKFREQISVREIARRTGLSRNTIRTWLRQEGMTQPRYPVRVMPSILEVL